jgi:hypothetical protein
VDPSALLFEGQLYEAGAYEAEGLVFRSFRDALEYLA